MAACSEPEEQKVRVQSGILSGGVELAAQNQHLQSSQEKQVDSSYSDLEPVYHGGLGYSDLEVVEPSYLEVSGSDSPQVIPPVYHHDHVSGSHTSLGVPPVYHHDGLEPKFEEQRLTSSNTGASFHYHGGQNPFDPSTNSTGDRRIWGLKRRAFWIVLGIVVFGVLLALGVGIGVGVGLNSNDSDTATTARYAHNFHFHTVFSWASLA